MNDFIPKLYKARKNLLSYIEYQGYNTDAYKNIGVTELIAMYNANELNMEFVSVAGSVAGEAGKLYVAFYLEPSNLKMSHIDLAHITAKDTLYVISNEDINESLIDAFITTYERTNKFIVSLSISALQINVLAHSYVPKHIVLTEAEKQAVIHKYNIANDDQFPEISRFDAVARCIGIRPTQVCKIIRSSKTAIESPYYRLCVNNL